MPLLLTRLWPFITGWVIGLAALTANAAPQLVTPQLQPGFQGQPYSASLMIGSLQPLTSAAVTGLPTGLTATHNGAGSVAIAGTPTASGGFTLGVTATDNSAGTLNTSVSLTISQVASNVTAVDAGLQHSCAVVNGGVQCWGRGSEGELGNNSTAQSNGPVQAIAAGSNVTAVSAGYDHTCAVVNGGVKCWGSNNGGSLGNNSITQSLVPVQAIAAGNNVTAVAAGRLHSCAVVNGGVQCWGYNGNGPLGNNSTAQSLVPVQAIAAGSNVTAVAAGDEHSCAVVNGGVQCWGYNTYGQLGNNSTTRSLVPVQAIAAGSNVTAVAAGYDHSCAVVNGGVQCWGANWSGELGNNSTTQSLVPVQAIAAGSNVTAIAVEQSHSCAAVNGGVQCWGYNTYGQLGNNSITQSLVPVQAIAAGSNVTAVAAGNLHSCAVVNGGVQCWGNNGTGELGNNGTAQSLVPVQAIATGSNVTAIAAGGNHSCAVVNGGVQCWGSNSNGQLGNGSSASTSTIPVQAIATGSNVTAVAAGDSHSCAVVNGGVQCWGLNSNGQIGNNSTAQSLVPMQAIAAGSNVTAVAAGSYHSCAVVNGGVKCWGYNWEGELGNNSTAQSLVPVQAIAAGSNVTAIAAGGNHSCAVVNGGVQCWGYSSNGQLGNNSTAQSLVPVQAIVAGSSVTAVAAGGYHSCAGVNGGVKCWGSNGSGQLGNNSTTQSLVPVQAIAAGSNVTAVAAGRNHSCAALNGAAQCWGYNAFGHLGNNSTTQSLVPAQAIAVGSNVTAVAAGVTHSCAVVSGGVGCWGFNSSGQLADAYSGPPSQPVTTLIPLTLIPQTVSFANPGNQIFGTTPTLTATATSGLTPRFTAAGSSAGICSITSGGSLTLIATGTCTINADQVGNGNYSVAAQVQRAFSIAAASQTISFTSLAPTTATVGGATYAATATASSNLPVTLTVNAASSATVCTITGGGVAAFIGVGTCQIDASQSGNANFNAALTVQQSFAVGKGDQVVTITTTAPVAATVGGATYAPAATSSAGLPVTITVNVASSLACSVSAGEVSFTGVGTCQIDATQAGTADYNPAMTQQSFAVGKGSQAIAFTSTIPPNAMVGGPTYLVTATGGASGNTLTFTIDATTAGVCSIAGSTVSFNGVGTCKVNADQLGNANYNAAAQAQQSFTVAASTNANLSALVMSSSSLVPGFASGTTAYTALVGNASTSVTATPTLADSHATVSVNGTAVTSGSPSGAINLTVGSANVISVAVTAQDGLTTQTYSITVTRSQATSATALAASANPIGLNQPVTFTASVTGDGVAPTGTVTFVDGATTLCAAVAVDGAGHAPCTTSTLTAGAHTIAASYSGDANNTASSGQILQTISAYALTSIDYPGAVYTDVRGINDNGEIVGYAAIGDGNNFGFRYVNGVFSPLPNPLPASGIVSFGSVAINDAGAIVGGGTTDAMSMSSTHAFVLENGSYNFFRHPDWAYTDGRGISPDGHWVTGTLGNADMSQVPGYLYEVQTGLFTLITVSDSWRVIPHQINSAGQIAGSADRAPVNGGHRAFLRDPNGTMNFFQISGKPTKARALNDHGQIGGFTTVNGVDTGFVGNASGYQMLSFPGMQAMYVEGMNNKGQVVGLWRDSMGINHGFMGSPATLPTGTTPQGAYTFAAAVVPSVPVFIDPVVATGYDYQTGAGDPWFATVRLPIGVGDSQYSIIVPTGCGAGALGTGTSYPVAGGVLFDFRTTGGCASGVPAFRVAGIETSAYIDPGLPQSFVTEITFVGAGTFTGTMTPSTAFTKWLSTTTLTSGNNPSTYGQSISLTATVVSNGPTPIGTVTFSEGATTLCASVALNGSAQATCNPGLLGAGPHTLTATYTDAGGNYFEGSGNLALQIDAAAQAIAFGSAPTVVVGGTGTVSSTGGASGIARVYTSTTLAACTVDSSTGVVSGVAAGSNNCAITANQGGNANYSAAAPASQSFSVGQASQTIVFGSAPTVVVGGTGTVSSTGGASGIARVYTSTTLAACTVNSSTGVVSGVAAGSNNCAITANQGGDANYLAASPATQNITIAARPLISFNPGALAFGVQHIGSTSAAQGVVVTNTGGSSLAISSINVTVNPADFALTGCVGTLAVGASCNLSVSFHPTATAARPATVTITSNAANSPQIGLSGTGVALNVPICTVSAAPARVRPSQATTLTAHCDSTSPATSYQWTGGLCAAGTTATCVANPSVTTTYGVIGSNVNGSSSEAFTTVKMAVDLTPILMLLLD